MAIVDELQPKSSREPIDNQVHNYLDLLSDLNIDQKNGTISFSISARENTVFSSGVPWGIEDKERKNISSFFMSDLEFDEDNLSRGYGWKKYRQLLNDRSYHITVSPIVSGQNPRAIAFRVNIEAGQGVHMHQPPQVCNDAVALLEPLLQALKTKPPTSRP